MITIDAFIHRSIRHWASRPRGRNEGCLLLPSQVRLRRRREILLFDNISEASTIGGYSCMRRAPLAERTLLPCVGPKSQTPNAVILHPSSKKELALSLFPEALEAKYVLKKPTRHLSMMGVHSCDSTFGVSRSDDDRDRPWRGCPDLRPD